MIDPSRVRAALDTVRDPELDTSIVELGFVSVCGVDDDGTARVRLRLPTYFCAPNFAFLMVTDAYDAVSRVDGVTAVDIELEDHFAADEINTGVAARAGFVAAFDGLAENELDDLRRDFLRKAMLAAQDRVVRPLLAAGVRAPGARRPPARRCRRLRRPRPLYEPDVSSWGSHPPTPTRCSCTSTGRRSLMARSASTFVAPAPWA